MKLIPHYLLFLPRSFVLLACSFLRFFSNYQPGTVGSYPRTITNSTGFLSASLALRKPASFYIRCD